VARLPLAIRNWDDLLALVPACRATASPRRAAARRRAAPAASTCTATRSLQNNFLLDGVDNNTHLDERARS
jgi:hypothetical protein